MGRKAAPKLSVVALQPTTISSKESVTYNKETQTVGGAATEPDGKRDGKNAQPLIHHLTVCISTNNLLFPTPASHDSPFGARSQKGSLLLFYFLLFSLLLFYFLLSSLLFFYFSIVSFAVLFLSQCLITLFPFCSSTLGLLW